jgi:AcrR family transcriptional regulator
MPVTDMTRGRPRDPGADVAILGATRELLAERGWAGFTIADVAARAGVAKTTIYRRWQSRAELAIDLLSTLFDQLELRDLGSLQADVEDVVRQFVALLSLPETRAAFLALVTATEQDAALRQRFRARVIEPQYRLVRAGRARAVKRGEIPVVEEEDDLVFDMIAGTMTHRMLITGLPIDDAYVSRLVTVFLAGFAATRQADRAPDDTSVDGNRPLGSCALVEYPEAERRQGEREGKHDQQAEKAEEAVNLGRDRAGREQ